MRYQTFSFWTDSVPYRWSHRLTSFVFGTLGDIETHGSEYIPRSGGILLLSNHLSYLDPFILATTATRELHYMARDNAFRIPLLGRIITSHNAYPVKRGTADRAALKHTIALLKQGKAVVIFPEGTRSIDGSLGKAHDGVSFIAHNADVPTIPVFIAGSDRLMPRRSIWVRPAKLSTNYGPPIDFTYAKTIQDKRVMYQHMSEQIMEGISALRTANTKP